MGRPSDPNARADLLAAAEAVFIESGVESATIEDITRRAGRSKGSFYLHFASKDDAFLEIVQTALGTLSGLLDAAHLELRGAHDPEEHLRAWLEKDVEIFEFLWANRGVTRLLLAGGGCAQFGYLIDEFAERARARTKRLFAEGVSLRLYRANLDVEVASLVLAGAYDRLVRELVRAPGKPDLRAWLVEVQRVLVHGIGGEAMRPLGDQAVSVRARPPASPRSAPKRAAAARKPHETRTRP